PPAPALEVPPEVEPPAPVPGCPPELAGVPPPEPAFVPVAGFPPVALEPPDVAAPVPPEAGERSEGSSAGEHAASRRSPPVAAKSGRRIARVRAAWADFMCVSGRQGSTGQL